LIFYSKTGKTKRIALRLKDLLSNAGLHVDIYEIKHRKEYLDKLLHLNPRLIMDTLLNKHVEFVGAEDFNPEGYDVIIIGSPIWYNTVVPAIKSFIKTFRGRIGNKPIICFTTSTLNIDYSTKFKEILQSLAYNVIFCKSFTAIEVERTINEFANNIITKLKSMLNSTSGVKDIRAILL